MGIDHHELVGGFIKRKLLIGMTEVDFCDGSTLTQCCQQILHFRDWVSTLDSLSA